MAITADDADLVAITADGLLPTCTTWLLLRRDRVLRDYTQALICRLQPQLHPRDLRRAVEEGEALLLRPRHWHEIYRPSVLGEFEI